MVQVTEFLSLIRETQTKFSAFCTDPGHCRHWESESVDEGSLSVYFCLSKSKNQKNQKQKQSQFSHYNNHINVVLCRGKKRLWHFSSYRSTSQAPGYLEENIQVDSFLPSIMAGHKVT